MASSPASPHQSSARPPQPSAAGAAPAPAGAGVPLSVWPAIPAPGACPASPVPVPCPQRWPVTAAVPVITALTLPGETVVIPYAVTPVFVDAAATAGRPVTAFTGPTHRDLRSFAAHLGPAVPPACRDLATIRPGGPAALLHSPGTLARAARLVILTACPTPGCPPPPSGCTPLPPPGPGLLYRACYKVLAPGGLLAVITTAAHHPSYPGDLTAHARAAGFTYTQHIITTHPTPPGPAPGPGWARHRAAHSDILLFRRPEGPRHG